MPPRVFNFDQRLSRNVAQIILYYHVTKQFKSHWSHLNFRFRTCFEQSDPWHSGNYRVCIHFEMLRRYSRMHRTDKNSQHSSIIWPVWLNGRVFVYELSGCGFDSSWSYLNFLLASIDWARAFDFRICVAQLTVISCIKILSSLTLCGWSGAFNFMVWFWWRKV